MHRGAQAVEDLDFLMSQRVLSPVQAAVFVSDTYPARPDALVLASTCASLGGEQQRHGLAWRNSGAAHNWPTTLTALQGFPALSGAKKLVDSKSVHSVGRTTGVILHAGSRQ